MNDPGEAGVVNGIIEVTLSKNPKYIMDCIEKIAKYNDMSKLAGLPVKSALAIDKHAYNRLKPSQVQRLNEVTSAGAYVFVLDNFRHDAFSKLNELNKALRSQP